MTRKEELELKAAQWLRHHGDQRLTRPLAALLEHVEREVWKDNRGKFWSFLRCVLVQGSAIQQDYQAGNFKSYEEYSARLDAAARDRVEEWLNSQQQELA